MSDTRFAITFAHYRDDYKCKNKCKIRNNRLEYQIKILVRALDNNCSVRQSNINTYKNNGTCICEIEKKNYLTWICLRFE